MPSYSAADVLQQLDDDASPEYAIFFPDLSAPNIHHVDARLTVYADEDTWVLVIEQLAVNPAAPQFGGVGTGLYYHGNAIVYPPMGGWDGGSAVRVIEPLADGTAPLLLDAVGGVNTFAADVRIRDQLVPIRTDAAHYHQRNIAVDVLTHDQIDSMIREATDYLPPELADAELARLERELRPQAGRANLHTWELLRGMIPEHRELLLATDDERREGVPPGLPMFLQLNDWEHPRLTEEELPSGSNSFQMIAQALEAGNPAFYRRSAARGNVNWQNWVGADM